MIRVLIIDDSAFMRKSLKIMLDSSGEVHVIGTARDGEEGLKKAFELKPDVVILDLEMPEMDGLTFLRIMMKHQPVPVIVISSRREESTVFKALELGAVDFLPKPTKGASPLIYSLRDQLLAKLVSLEHLNFRSVQRRLIDLPHSLRIGEAGPRTRVKTRPAIPGPGEGIRPVRAVVIGASTGGPSALQRLLSPLPEGLDAGIAIAQHMPQGFTRAFAERLDRYTALQVKEAQSGDLFLPGRVLVAPGGYNLHFHSSGEKAFVALKKKRPEDRYIPSVDTLFTSASAVFGPRLLGIVLTGMGSDGREGAKEIKKTGGTIVAESPETAVIFGMPKEIIESGIADKILPLSRIAQEIVRWGKLAGGND